MGGDQQVGALISGKIDVLIFFWDRLTRYRTTPMSKRYCVLGHRMELIAMRH